MLSNFPYKVTFEITPSCKIYIFSALSDMQVLTYGTIHLRRRHILGGARGQKLAKFANGLVVKISQREGDGL